MHIFFNLFRFFVQFGYQSVDGLETVPDDEGGALGGGLLKKQQRGVAPAYMCFLACLAFQGYTGFGASKQS